MIDKDFTPTKKGFDHLDFAGWTFPYQNTPGINSAIRATGCNYLQTLRIVSVISKMSFTVEGVNDTYDWAVNQGHMEPNCFVRRGDEIIRKFLNRVVNLRHEWGDDYKVKETDEWQEFALLHYQGPKGQHFIAEWDDWDSWKGGSTFLDGAKVVKKNVYRIWK